MPNSLPVYKLFPCPYKGCEISVVGARQCNYSNLDDYTCRHTGELCVASEGLEAFAQSLSDSVPEISPDAFQQMKEKMALEQAKEKAAQIIRLVNVYYPSKAGLLNPFKRNSLSDNYLLRKPKCTKPLKTKEDID